MKSSPYLICSTFSYNGYLEYGRNFLRSYLNFASDIPLCLVIDNEVLFDLINSDFDLSSFMLVKNSYINEIDCLCLKRATFDNEHKFKYSPEKFVYKPSSLMTLLAGGHCDGFKYLVWVDGDSVFLKSGLGNLLNYISPKPNQIASVFDRLDYRNHLEAGLMVFNLAHVQTEKYIFDVLDCFLSGKIFSMLEWHDAFIFTHYINSRPPDSFRLLCIEFNIKGDHPIATWDESKKYLDHLKGRRKRLGFSPETISNTLYRKILVLLAKIKSLF